MSISEKTRKILWGRSGNRCAICRRELVVEGTVSDDESVVGDECHIVSGSERGPRFDPDFPRDRLDDTANLILLCRVHHKMVDDQCETYTPGLLRTLKKNHEGWVTSSLKEQPAPPPVRIRSVEGGTPTHLRRLSTGQEVLNIVGGASAFSFDHDSLETKEETELVADLLQDAQDYGDLWAEMEAGRRVEAAYWMSTLLKQVNDAGFWVFGGREIRRIEGGVGAPAPFPVAVLRILRHTNPEIIRIDLESNDREESGSD